MASKPRSKRPKSRPRKKRRFWLKPLMGLVLAACVMFTLSQLALPLVPIPEGLKSQKRAAEITVQSSKELRIADSEPGYFHQRVTYAEIPTSLIQATLAAEDKRFWEHSGVDYYANARAIWQMVRNRRVISGASTVTQQLIKLAQPRPRNFATKVFEAVQATRIEQVWSKEQILTEYLNRVEYGNRTQGCAAAAWFYFEKPLMDLSTAECAFLAGLPQAPSRLNPLKYFNRAYKRQQWILQRLKECGWISSAEYERARDEKLLLAAPTHTFVAPDLADAVGPGRTYSDLEDRP